MRTARWTGNRRPNRRRWYRPGLTLLEVMLALAILGCCIAVLGELIRIGSLSAEISRDEAKAQLLCETKMAEIAAGIVPPEPIGPVPFELETQWLYTVSVQPLQEQELVSVTVLVEQAGESTPAVTNQRLASFQLTRWVAQPEVSDEQTSEQESDESSDATGGQQDGTGAGGSNASGSGTGSSANTGAAGGGSATGGTGQGGR